MTALTLGPVEFASFEIPARIDFGGGQRLAVHTLPGGVRVIDAIGRDDAPIAWAGVFSGTDAGERVRLLDLLRASGAPLLLVWDEFVYEVIIARFEARFERSNWIPYRIVCLVVSDLALPQQLALSLASQLGADLVSAGAYPGVDVSPATTALAVPGATTLGTQAYGQAREAIGTATTNTANRLDAGSTALAQAQTVPVATAAAGQMAQASAALGYLRRASGNLARAGS